MKLKFFFALLMGTVGLVAVLTSCQPALKPQEVLLSSKQTAESQAAVDRVKPGYVLEVKIDTYYPAQEIAHDVFSSCRGNESTQEVKFTSNDNYTPTVNSISCLKLPHSYVGFIKVWTTSSKGNERWVSCPAILLTDARKGNILVTKQFISLNQNGDEGEYFFVQEEPSVGYPTVGPGNQCP